MRAKGCLERYESDCLPARFHIPKEQNP